jgi:hypothetical protein
VLISLLDNLDFCSTFYLFMAGKLTEEMHSLFATISIKTLYLCYLNTGSGSILVFLVKHYTKPSTIKCTTFFLHHCQSYGTPFTISNSQKNNS